jgi:hypothetical protein
MDSLNGNTYGGMLSRKGCVFKISRLSGSPAAKHPRFQNGYSSLPLFGERLVAPDLQAFGVQLG